MVPVDMDDGRAYFRENRVEGAGGLLGLAAERSDVSLHAELLELV
ncbi:MAG: hypothetical protein R2748_13785 [Bryobacterales bacterium]